MRLFALTAAALLASASTAVAAPASVSVVIGPELQKKAEQTYGVREMRILADDLQTSVEKRLARTGAYDGARVELTLVDAKPNRPTFEQLGKTPGLSLESFGIGGATIEGRIVRADGSAQPVGYRWYETDIRQAYGYSTWHDAMWTFDRFAGRLAKGDELAAR
jgi:hypothetical protein